MHGTNCPTACAKKGSLDFIAADFPPTISQRVRYNHHQLNNQWHRFCIDIIHNIFTFLYLRSWLIVNSFNISPARFADSRVTTSG